MTARRRSRRRPRVYLRGHLGCLGCSLPLAMLAALGSLLLAVILL